MNCDIDSCQIKSGDGYCCFAVPENPEIRKKWVKFIAECNGRDPIKKKLRICELHFEAREIYRSSYRAQVLPGVVPSIHVRMDIDSNNESKKLTNNTLMRNLDDENKFHSLTKNQERICRCCLIDKRRQMRQIDKHLESAFRDLIGDFNLGDGYVCIICYTCLTNFKTFRNSIMPKHVKLLEDAKKIIESPTSSEIKIKLEPPEEDEISIAVPKQKLDLNINAISYAGLKSKLSNSIVVKRLSKHPIPEPDIPQTCEDLQEPLMTEIKTEEFKESPIIQGPFHETVRVKEEKIDESYERKNPDPVPPSVVDSFNEEKVAPKTLNAAWTIIIKDKNEPVLMDMNNPKWKKIRIVNPKNVGCQVAPGGMKKTFTKAALPTYITQVNNAPPVPSQPKFSAPVETSFTCDLCGFQSKDKEIFTRHVGVWHIKDYDKFPCDSCKYVARSKDTLIAHQNREHLDRGEFTCIHCYSIFADVNLMRKHCEELHPYTIKKKKVSVCFRTKYKDILRRAEIPSSSNKPTKCPFCGSRMPEKNLNYHIFVVHKRERSHQCDICGDCFRSFTGLKDHQLTHHGNGVKKFRCDLCGEHYVSRRKTYKHMRQVHLPKTHRCKLCLKGFSVGQGLRRHMKRSHTGNEKEDGMKANIKTNCFHCPICDHQFFRKLSCQQHIQARHKKK